MEYYCEICGWIYDEERGCKKLGIKPDTKFDDLPQDFRCPECSSTIDAFSVLE